MNVSKLLPKTDWIPRSADTANIPKWVLYSGLGIGLAVSAGCITWYAQPSPVINFKMQLALKRAGFSIKHVQGATHNYCYAERGSLRSDMASIVCISGLSGCKEDWLLFTEGIQSDLHIILLDLPGQGHSSIPKDPADTSIYALRDMIAEFARLTDLEVIPMHLVGISLGASLSALYAAKYPKSVDRLTLICPSMQCPIETEAWQEIASETDKSGLVNLSNSTFYDPARKPHTIWKYRCLQQLGKAKQEFQKNLRAKQFVELTDESKPFEELLASVKAPSQIIWGENDEILHVSGASLLEEILSTTKRVDIIEECGHVVHLEKPEITRGLVMDFHNTTYSAFY